MAGDSTELLKRVREAAGRDPRVDLKDIRIDVADDGTVTLTGEVANVAAKRRALRGAASLKEVPGVVDRLRVRPAGKMGDGEIRDHVRNALVGEPAFNLYELRVREGDRVETVRLAADEPRGWIELAVEDGIVTLNGRVLGLESKRLAGVLAWWVPGSRDVINGLAVEPPEEDGDDALANAVRLVLEKDRLVDQDHVHIGAHDGVVTLAGILPDEAQKDMAEFDAWYVFGGDDVVNDIEVYPYAQRGDLGRRMAERAPAEERVGGPPQGGRKLP